jgi:hypothetical protein
MPTLPNLAMAIINRRKITHYLLSIDHPTGRGKAAFFFSFGFRVQEPEVLERGLIAHAKQNDVTQSIETEFGIKFIITGSIQTPIGVSPRICVVWFCPKDEKAPQLVTAFPD